MRDRGNASGLRILARRAAVTAVTGTIAGLLLIGASESTDETVSASQAQDTSVAAVEAAREYARRHDLTSCTHPQDAELDDVILALDNRPDGMPDMSASITELDFDEALASHAYARTNLIACNRQEN